MGYVGWRVLRDTTQESKHAKMAVSTIKCRQPFLHSSPIGERVPQNSQTKAPQGFSALRGVNNLFYFVVFSLCCGRVFYTV